ncbi:MAG: hypothetical protein ACLTBV_18940 [Enterocloster bolteae]
MTKQIRKGYGTVILASLAYGVMPVVSKLLLLSGMNSESVVFYRFSHMFVLGSDSGCF